MTIINTMSLLDMYFYWRKRIFLRNIKLRKYVVITYEKLSIRINSKKKFIRLKECLRNVRILMRLPQEKKV